MLSAGKRQRLRRTDTAVIWCQVTVELEQHCVHHNEQRYLLQHPHFHSTRGDDQTAENAQIFKLFATNPMLLDKDMRKANKK
jgi:hypothetical protein